MELIRISDRKLKIMLTPMDMCHFELNPDRFGEDSAQMHRSFRLLLSEVRKQTDFKADDNHLSVQYFPSRGGGCEMFICNLTDSDESPTSPPTASTELRPYQKSRGGFRRECAFRIERLDHLLAVCRRLSAHTLVCESSVFRDEGGDYFLFLTILAPSPYTTPEELGFVAEYGTQENASVLRIYIREHASVICQEGAIFTMSTLA